MRNRAWRRYQKIKQKNKAKHIAKIFWIEDYDDDKAKKDIILSAIKLADNLKHCQHYGCGNVRRDPWCGEATLQEIKTEIELQEGCKALLLEQQLHS